jgi:60 kDa SS-A/Ro ribonucleoprotein
MRVNSKAVDFRVDTTTHVAGGFGVHAAHQSALAHLRRLVLTNLLWEDVAYAKGTALSDAMATLVPQIAPETVAALAIEARTHQKLRHVPLFLAREMARHPTHRSLLGTLLPKIILRADELTEFLALYWRDGKQPLAKQVKIGLARALARFSAYDLAKYNQDRTVKLRDVLFLTHAKPTPDREDLYRQLATNTLPVPDTWEVALSRGEDKKATWERLIVTRQLGALAFLRNLRNMEQAGVTPSIIAEGLAHLQTGWLLPLNYLAAAKAAPRWQRELETAMLRSLANGQQLPGYTVLIVDVSGSMGHGLSAKSDFTRLDAAGALTILAEATCERLAIYATSGSDGLRQHATELVPTQRGFALAGGLTQAAQRLGGGGIFTRQCLAYVRMQEREVPDRILVFSDSQDCDVPGSPMPHPFGTRNYLIDVSAEQHGINYDGIWTAEISGWSERFLSFIAALETPNDLQMSPPALV